MMESVEAIKEKIIQRGDKIRQMKTAKAPAEDITKEVEILTSLKEQFKVANNGIPYDPPKQKQETAPKAAPVAAPVQREGPSKKELNKLARKEGKKKGKEAGADDAADSATASPISPSPNMATVGAKSETNVITFHPAHPPTLTRHVLALLPPKTQLPTLLSSGSSTSPHVANMGSADGKSTLSGDAFIAKFIARQHGLTLCGAENDNWAQSEVDQWLGVFNSLPPNSETALADTLNSHLESRTYIVGHDLTLADIAMKIAVSKRSLPPASSHPHLTRWFSLVSSAIPTLPALQFAKGNGKETNKSSSKAGDGAPEDDSEVCPPLEGAIDGAVCTRFPPEPSGYLHIGHCKAVLLNQYYAQRYHGRLLVRFDDTNPSKEKDEFEENIVQDLATLGVVADKVSHTSDHFAIMEEYARKMINEGKAYMDDTPQEKMQLERGSMTESYRRNSTPQENLAIFESLLKGEESAQSFCLRAKIDMKSVNGTLRDPVLYRYNGTPHHRTGTKFKAYPTYDFACPIVDSIEGVTHALRTTEYNDRDEQYHWLQEALKIRPVKIQAFGKMNFVHTVLSKRKLQWFVEEGLVEGWFDPRMPTVQGCVRRGMNVAALKSFIVSQGASRRIITMEWDKFWAENKKVLEDQAARYMGVSETDSVLVHVTNLPNDPQATMVHIHPQKPEVGMRVMRKSNYLLIDQCDASTFCEGEEVTFLRWGNFNIQSIERTNDKVTKIIAAFNPSATDFKKTKKTTWLAKVPEIVTAKVFEFDHLISKAKLEEDEDFKQFVNSNSKTEYSMLCDPCLKTVAVGEVIQLERKGFFRVDEAYKGPGKPIVLFAIPDGKKVKKNT